MATLQITLDERTQSAAEAQAVAAGFGNVGDYVAALLQTDQRRREKAQLDEKLTAAIESGPADEMTAADWDHIRAAVRNGAGSSKAAE